MSAPVITDSVASLVDALTDTVIAALGSSSKEVGPLSLGGDRHVLRLQLGKVVANYLLRASTAQ